MTTLLEAAKQALEALEKAAEWSDYGKDDAEFGLRHCCGVADWKPHSKHCRLLPIITTLRAEIEAAEKVEPVAIVKDGVLKRCDLPKGFTGKLYLHPAPTIPEGWQLVPKDPTAEMSSFMNTGVYNPVSCERIYKAMLQVRRQYPAEPEIRPSASKVDKMRAVLIANRKARQQANEQKILRLLKRQPMTLRQIVETIDLSKSTAHYLVKDLALRGDIRSEKIRGVTHWKNARRRGD